MDTAEKATGDDPSAASAGASSATIRSQSNTSKGARPKSYVVKVPTSQSKEVESYRTSSRSRRRPRDDLYAVAVNQETFKEVLTPDLDAHLEEYDTGCVDAHLRHVEISGTYKITKFPLYSMYFKRSVNTVLYGGVDVHLKHICVYNVYADRVDHNLEFRLMRQHEKDKVKAAGFHVRSNPTLRYPTEILDCMVVVTSIYLPIPIPYLRKIEDLPSEDRMIMEEYRKNEQPLYKLMQCRPNKNGTGVSWSPTWKYKQEPNMLPICDHTEDTRFLLEKAGILQK